MLCSLGLLGRDGVAVAGSMKAHGPITARELRATEQELVVVLADREVRIAWEDCSPRLAAATWDQRQRAELSPGGYGIHWPLIDEDLSIGGLVRQCGRAGR